MSNGAKRFRKGGRPRKGQEPKSTRSNGKPAPNIPVSIEDKHKKLLGRAQALFLGNSEVDILTCTPLEVGSEVFLVKKSNKVNKERVWRCQIAEAKRETDKKSEYRLKII